jgi:hypothetical protein
MGGAAARRGNMSLQSNQTCRSLQTRHAAERICVHLLAATSTINPAVRVASITAPPRKAQTVPSLFTRVHSGDNDVQTCQNTN